MRMHTHYMSLNPYTSKTQPAGLYAVTAGCDNLVCLWDVSKATCVARARSPSIVCGISWHPSDNELALVRPGRTP